MIAKESTLKKTARGAQIEQVREKGLCATIVRRERLREFHVTVEPLPGEPPQAVARRLHAFVAANSARIVREEAFGTNAACRELIAARSSELNCPITCVEAFSCENAPLAGLHALAVSGLEIESIFEGTRPVGTVFSDGFARHCILGDITPEISNPGRKRWTHQVFQKFASHLESVGMELTDIARTWLFLDGILDWYGPFNQERREIFEQFHVFDHCVPASTGIGAANPHQAALVAGAWAVRPIRDSALVQPVESPLQCSARDYGSCFSRAVEISSPDQRRLLISGTASIAPDGATKFVDDVRKQIGRTMEVVEAILSSRGMHWRDTSRATVYLRNASDAWAFREYMEEQELVLPVLLTEATVCRDDLLFEIELDALAGPRQGRSSQHGRI